MRTVNLKVKRERRNIGKEIEIWADKVVQQSKQSFTAATARMTSSQKSDKDLVLRFP